MPYLIKTYDAKEIAKYYLNRLGMRSYSKIRLPIINSEVQVRSHAAWKDMQEGKWEPGCIRVLSEMVKENQVFFDIGAEFGQYTILLSELMRGTGFVYGFEPEPKNFDVLKDNIQKNNLTNINIESFCVSNVVGEAKLWRFQFGGVSSMIKSARTSKLNRTTVNTVRTTTIDDYCQTRNILPNGLIIDVEGAERLVAEGSQKTMEKCSPWILLEFHGQYMSKEEKAASWKAFADSAESVLFIDDGNREYPYGTKLYSLPDCNYFHVFIRY